VAVLPEFIVPEALTSMTLFAESAIDVSSLTALMPALPDVIRSPDEVVTLMFPVSRLSARIP
jgi:hypothetical protein